MYLCVCVLMQEHGCSMAVTDLFQQIGTAQALGTPYLPGAVARARRKEAVHNTAA